MTSSYHEHTWILGHYLIQINSMLIVGYHMMPIINDDDG